MTSDGRQRVVMVTTSYPRFPGDIVGTFVEPIAHGVAALGHEVHIVAPWHPLVRRPKREDGVTFHFFRYAPLLRLNVFGYADALRADVALRPAAVVVAPLAITAGVATVRRVVREIRATVVHGHWAVPGGVMATIGAPRLPCVISLHGSDLFVAERYAVPRMAARAALRRAAWITACSHDLQRRAVALGAPDERIEVVPYGVDVTRFRPDAAAAATTRDTLGVNAGDPLIVAVGRLVRKKGFEYAIDAVAAVAGRWPRLQIVIAGDGDLAGDLRRRAVDRGVGDRVRFLGTVSQNRVPGLLAAADLVVVPSVRDDRGNVDGLPNVVLEALATGAAVVSTPAGGITSVARDGQTAAIVPERDVNALAARIDELLRHPERRKALGESARHAMTHDHTWNHVATRLDEIYVRVGADRTS